MAIDSLPDDVLLCVFEFYLAEALKLEAWLTLVHVCRQWRVVVFSSPRRLNLRLTCPNDTPVKKKLDVWPSLPIVISSSFTCESKMSLDNIVTALEHNRRVCQIQLHLTRGRFEDVFHLLKRPQPFPELKVLDLYVFTNPDADPIAVFPSSGQFLSGATHLRSLSLTCFPMPGLSNLLLSLTDLVDLRLDHIPISGFISPDKLVTALSALAKLQVLHFGHKFDEDDLHPDWENRRLPLPTRTVLPSLIELKFEGAIEYLEDFMARIDAPLLDRLDIIVFLFRYRVIAPDTRAPQLLQFISHVPKLRVLTEAHIANFRFQARINFRTTRKSSGVLKQLNLETRCFELELLFPVLAQLCRSPFFPLPTLESLYIDRGTHSGEWLPQDDTRNTRWLEILQPFTSVKNLYFSNEYAPLIASTLEDPHGETVMELLPALENVFIEKLDLFGSVYVAFRNFAATRQLSSGHPIVVSDWDRTGSITGR